MNDRLGRIPEAQLVRSADTDHAFATPISVLLEVLDALNYGVLKAVLSYTIIDQEDRDD